MHPTFTGSARAKRQVNLSGRTNNPFAVYGSSTPSNTSQTAINAVAHAQRERLAREQERKRPPAAAKIQRTWRGHRSRRETRRQWRNEWDEMEHLSGPQIKAFSTDAECLVQLRLLAQFATAKSEDDIQRILHFSERFLIHAPDPWTIVGEPWQYPAFRIARLIVRVLGAPGLENRANQFILRLCSLLFALTLSSTFYLSKYSEEYYKAVNNFSRFCQDTSYKRGMVKVLLQGKHSEVKAAYRGFAWVYLTQSELPGYEDDVHALSRYVDYGPLAASLLESLSTKSNQQLLSMNHDDKLLWLLARFIYFHQHPRPEEGRTSQPDAPYVKLVSTLITVLADDIGKRIDNFDLRSTSHRAVTNGETNGSSVKSLPDFVRSQILSLVSQGNVTGLLSKLEHDASLSTDKAQSPGETSALASYVLTLLRVFPRRRSDIQLWLFRGSVLSQDGSQRKLPATKYLYQAAQSTLLFSRITNDPKQTIPFLAPDEQHMVRNDLASSAPDSRDQQWRIIFLFLEMYSFTLQVMDDEEFHSGSTQPDPSLSWTKQSALALVDVQNLSIFLKNLAFALYWYSSQIAGEQERKNIQGLAAYFGKGEAYAEDEEDDMAGKAGDREVAGVSGMTITSLKGLVVGVLRMIYQRDSRRKFLPRDHWLMTGYLEMVKFIASVVAEEEHGRQIEESYDADDAEQRNTDSFPSAQEPEDIDTDEDLQLVGTQRTQQLRAMERLRLRQRKASKRKYLESVTPRLRILENMPFFIPFHTRVQIFRQLVELDQLHRRGTTDADEWRYAQMNSVMGNISRHRATVRREHIFDDAYKQYYDLAEGLKEPIQIRFVDKFGTVEEGIDGGGVTKEFLTSVTNEAFGGANGLESLFTENDQHLLFPNPSAVEERRETLRQAMCREGSPDWNETIRELLRRYEFLGRLIGKCLYEGILIDIQFAPFFLLKWALTGGTGSGAKETGYRANINDLRDLDERLYQGLLQLKNYPGNVQEDFSLDFTVTDTLRLSPTQTKVVTRDLRSNGSEVAVTNENRLVYIAVIAHYRLQSQPYAQTSAFLRGLGTIISPSWLSMFNQSELQTLIGGSGSEISISDLRANTQYGGVYAIGDDGLEHPTIQLFWKTLEKMSMEDVAKVLKFVTSTPRAPLLGFGNLNPKFSIRDSGADQSRLPSTSTCVNLLKLPIYKDEAVLRERLLYSVNSNAGFNLS